MHGQQNINIIKFEIHNYVFFLLFYMCMNFVSHTDGGVYAEGV